MCEIKPGQSVIKVSKYVVCTTFLGNLCHCLTVLMGKKKSKEDTHIETLVSTYTFFPFSQHEFLLRALLSLIDDLVGTGKLLDVPPNDLSSRLKMPLSLGPSSQDLCSSPRWVCRDTVVVLCCLAALLAYAHFAVLCTIAKGLFPLQTSADEDS